MREHLNILKYGNGRGSPSEKKSPPKNETFAEILGQRTPPNNQQALKSSSPPSPKLGENTYLKKDKVRFGKFSEYTRQENMK
jgi:hypothetical protein